MFANTVNKAKSVGRGATDVPVKIAAVALFVIVLLGVAGMVGIRAMSKCRSRGHEEYIEPNPESPKRERNESDPESPAV